MENTTAPSREELRQRLRFQQMRGKMMRMKSESREALKEKAIQKAQASLPQQDVPPAPDVSLANLVPDVQEIQEQLASSYTVPIQGTLVGDNNREMMRGPSLAV